MKRVQAACLKQTIHFQLKDNIAHALAVRMVKDEFASYKKLLEANKTKFKIVDEKTQNDGSIVIEVKKQHGSYELGDYFD
ncbi:MAG: hypothetical protein LBT23_12270 [Synergistaceae bacterium]|nr:hypothetical protein [Synergistaceae bacterium]